MRIKPLNEFVNILEAQQNLKLNVPKDVKDLHKLFKKAKNQKTLI